MSGCAENAASRFHRSSRDARRDHAKLLYRQGVIHCISPRAAARMLRRAASYINNRLVTLLAYNESRDPLLLAELETALKFVALLRLSPRGQRLKPTMLYRLLAVNTLRGTVQGRAAIRVKLWADVYTRNRRSLAEVERLAIAFHRDAALLLSRGQSPAYLLEALHRDDRPDQPDLETGEE